MANQPREKRALRESWLPGRASSLLPPRSSVRPTAHQRRGESLHPDVVAEASADSSLPPHTARTGGHGAAPVGELGRLMGTALGLPGLQDEDAHISATRAPGAPAGIDHIDERLEPPEFGRVHLRVVDICQEHVETHWFDDVESLLESTKPEWSELRWIDVDGLHAYVISQIQQAFGFHTLAAEDVLQVPQRPRVDSYHDHMFVVARMFSVRDEQLLSEQVSVFVKPGLIVSFQESHADVWSSIRTRLELESHTLGQSDASYLLYCLLDAMIDHCFPILERYGEKLDQLEDAVLAAAAGDILQEVHGIKRELTIVRKALWPMREVLGELSRVKHRLVSDTTRTYLRDVYQHSVQILDIIETFRELAASLTDLSLSMASKRMNEVMKVLTMMSSVFIPITFLAGVYGMNFDEIPELHYHYSYHVFWIVCIALAVTLAWYFRRKGWWGRDS